MPRRNEHRLGRITGGLTVAVGLLMLALPKVSASATWTARFENGDFVPADVAVQSNLPGCDPNVANTCDAVTHDSPCACDGKVRNSADWIDLVDFNAADSHLIEFWQNDNGNDTCITLVVGGRELANSPFAILAKVNDEVWNVSLRISDECRDGRRRNRFESDSVPSVPGSVESLDPVNDPEGANGFVLHVHQNDIPLRWQAPSRKGEVLGEISIGDLVFMPPPECGNGVCETGEDSCICGADCGAADDSDFDSFTICDDCDDDDPLVNPGTAEVCDGVDNNCDGQIDEGCPCSLGQAGDPCDNDSQCCSGKCKGNGTCR